MLFQEEKAFISNVKVNIWNFNWNLSSFQTRWNSAKGRLSCINCSCIHSQQSLTLRMTDKQQLTDWSLFCPLSMFVLWSWLCVTGHNGSDVVVVMCRTCADCDKTRATPYLNHLKTKIQLQSRPSVLHRPQTKPWTRRCYWGNDSSNTNHLSLQGTVGAKILKVLRIKWL